jgi:hypothetical protein
MAATRMEAELSLCWSWREYFLTCTQMQKQHQSILFINAVFSLNLVAAIFKLLNFFCIREIPSFDSLTKQFQ